ncbi:MAG: response regulator [Candidatus Dormibacteria bacterium]
MRKVRVVIVDDSAPARASVRSLLEAINEGIEVAGEADGGEAGVGLCRELRPDLVLMDVEMPELDGPSATRRLLADTPGLPVIALSVSDTTEHRGAMTRAGARGYLVKGAGPAEVRAAIRSTVNRELGGSEESGRTGLL